MTERRRQSAKSSPFRGLGGFAMAFFLAFFCSLAASAHQTGKSTFIVHIKPETGEVDTLLAGPTIDAGDGAFGYGPGEHDWTRERLTQAWPRIRAYLDENIAVTNDGKPCKVLEQKTSDPGDPVALWFLKAFQCEQPLGEVVLKNSAMVETPGGYRHFARIQVGEGDVKATVFNDRTPTYTVSIPRSAADPPSGLGETFVRYLWEGVLHIVFGWDHVLFVIGLVLIAVRLKQLMLIVTAFTVSHSVTLILSALEVVAVPASIVEPVIALSVAWVAVEAVLKRDDTRIAYAATFLLGFVHGFGFSYVLRDNVGLPTEALVPALLAFNVGVELGQLGIVGLTYPVRAWLREKAFERRVIYAVAGIIGVIALYWFVERVFLS